MRVFNIFAQARVASKRFPNKIASVIAGESWLRHVVRRLGHLARRWDARLIMLVSSSSKYVVQRLLQNSKDVFAIMAGSEEDVLQRFYQATLRWPSEHVVRATCDNVVICGFHFDMLLNFHLRNCVDLSRIVGLPLGTSVEVFKSSSLKVADRHASKWYQREHVSPFIYQSPSMEVMEHDVLDSKYRRSDIRLTLDYPQDFQIFWELNAIANKLKEGWSLSNVSLERIIQLWDQFEFGKKYASFLATRTLLRK